MIFEAYIKQINEVQPNGCDLDQGVAMWDYGFWHIDDLELTVGGHELGDVYGFHLCHLLSRKSMCGTTWLQLYECIEACLGVGRGEDRPRSSQRIGI